LVLRTQVEGEWSFRELLGRVREVCLGGYGHQEVPFEMLVEQLQPERSLSHTPLFQVMFTLQNTGAESLALPGLRLAQLPPPTTTAKFDLTLSLAQTGESLYAAMEYNTDLFDEETVRRLLRHYEKVLESVVAAPEQALAQITLLNEAEREQLLVEWNDTTQEYPAHCLHELFSAQAARTPEAVALVYEAEQLTYRELNERANQLAHYLQGRGVGPEVLVGVMVERSLEMVVGLLGILKAGGAYLPLDPEYPQARLALMLEEAEVSVLLTQARLLSQLPQHGAEVVLLDGEWPAISSESAAEPASTTTAANLAYVMYTSGSTGRPKGVGIPHRGVVRLVSESNYVELSAGEVLLQLAPVSFDASTFEIWGALLNGARLVVMGAGAPTLAGIGQMLMEHKVTTLWLTAGLFHLMVDERVAELGQVRQVLAGGDVLSVAHVVKLLGAEGVAGRRVINGYGPTENTTFSSCYVMSEEREVGATVAIGRPVGNTTVYVLDERLEIVPAGVAGELYTGGEGLARGYLKDAAQTAERFVPHPYSRVAGARLYRTGDVVRWLNDGMLEYLGRGDQQVKVRGYRIELGEIEAALSRHEAVREVVVVARDEAGTGGGKRLVCYCVRKEGAAVTAAELRAEVRARLPEYMVPGVVVFVGELPLTPSGKVEST
jgi:aspartate racemase